MLNCLGNHDFRKRESEIQHILFLSSINILQVNLEIPTETHEDVHKKCSKFVLDFSKNWSVSTVLVKFRNMKFNENPLEFSEYFWGLRLKIKSAWIYGQLNGLLYSIWEKYPLNSTNHIKSSIEVLAKSCYIYVY